MIREATVDDLPKLIELSRDFLAATPYGRLLVPLPGVLEGFVAAVQEYGVALVATSTPSPIVEAEGRAPIVGMIGLVA